MEDFGTPSTWLATSTTTDQILQVLTDNKDTLLVARSSPKCDIVGDETNLRQDEVHQCLRL